MHLSGNLVNFLTWNFFKLVHKWRSYNQQYNSLLFWPTLYRSGQKNGQ